MAIELHDAADKVAEALRAEGVEPTIEAVYSRLRAEGNRELPELWTVIDFADYVREWAARTHRAT